MPPFDTGNSNAPVQIVITGPKLEELDHLAQKTMDELKTIKGVVGIDNDFEKGKPELTITVLRENAKRLGVTTQEIVSMFGSAFSSDIAISSYEEDGRQYDITLRFRDENRITIDDIKRLQVKNAQGEFISLEGLIEINDGAGATSINRFDRQRKILVTANTFEISLSDVVAHMTQKMPEILPEGYSYRFTGSIEEMQKTANAFGLAVGMAVILIYLILAALYESLIQPFIIMVAMPLSFTGVILGLYLTGNPFSLFVLIGIILLLGMVGKNAILVVDFANKAIKEGHSIEEALAQAGEKRLRPILMTTFAMVFAMMPLAISTGPGHELNAPMATSIIGGLISSMLLTLLVIPAIYRLLYPVDAWLRKFYERETVG